MEAEKKTQTQVTEAFMVAIEFARIYVDIQSKIKATKWNCFINEAFFSITCFYCLFIDLIVYLFPNYHLNTPMLDES